MCGKCRKYGPFWSQFFVHSLVSTGLNALMWRVNKPNDILFLWLLATRGGAHQELKMNFHLPYLLLPAKHNAITIIFSLVTGICRGYGAGTISLQVRVGSCVFDTVGGHTADLYSGWNSWSRMMAQEVREGQKNSVGTCRC